MEILRKLNLSEEHSEARNHKAESHQRKPGPDYHASKVRSAER